jgi:hypothetical protein
VVKIARVGGRFGRLYLGTTTAAAASPVPFIGNWSLGASTDKIDVTSMGDANKVVVPGLPDASGEVGGFFDDTTNTLYACAIDGLDRAFYLYATSNNTANYWYGRVFVDASFSASVDGAVEMSGTWAAAGSISFK